MYSNCCTNVFKQYGEVRDLQICDYKSGFKIYKSLGNAYKLFY